MTRGDDMPDNMLLDVYSVLAGLKKDFEVKAGRSGDVARARLRRQFAQAIVRRGLLDPGCHCNVCRAVRGDMALTK
jgi:hypothetical protein